MKAHSNNTLFCLLLFLIYFIGFQSCTKNNDNEYPKITILKPYENQIFSYGDTIPVEADISYSSRIEGVSVTLCNENFIHVMKSYSVYLKNNSSQKIIFIYPLDDRFIASGDYYLEITAIGSNNTKNKYVKLRISGLQKENKGLGLIVKNGNNSDLVFIDSAWQPHIKSTFYGNHIASAYLPYHNIFTEITDGISNTTAINFFSGKEEWKVDNLSQPAEPCFTGTFSSDKKIDILYYSSRAETYSYDGKKKASFSLTQNYIPKLSMHINDLWIVYQKKKNQPESGLFTVYYGSTGALIQSYSIDFEMVRFFKKNTDEVVIFGNKNGQALVKVYYIKNNTFWEPRTLNTSLLTDAIQLNSDTYLYLQNGHLIQFDLTHAWLFDKGLIQGNANFTYMKYDDLNSVIYLSDYQQISAITYPDLTPVNNYSSTDSILNFHIIYNK